MDDYANPDAFFSSLRDDDPPGIVDHSPAGNDAYLSALRHTGPADETARHLGQVVAGALSSGLDVRLDRDRALEDLAVGRYVVIRVGQRLFFGMITDITLDSTNPAFEKTPPDLSSEFLRQVYLGTSTFGLVHVTPMLLLNLDDLKPKPVKTIPGHYADVSAASPEEVGYVFGEEGSRKDADGKTATYFHVGEPLDMEDVKITLNLNRLVERSSAVFGKSGTGKTFLSRMLLAGVIEQDVAVNLVFDMHNEYGWEGASEGATTKVKGLKQLFPGRVVIATLDDESSRRRQSNPDFTVTLGYEHIEPEDVEMLAGVWNLSEAQVGALAVMRRRMGPTWLKNFMEDGWVDAYRSEDEESGKVLMGIKALADDLGQPMQTLDALRRRFEKLRRYAFIQEGAEDAVGRIVQHLQAGKHVVLEFGRYGSDLDAYLLVANFLTRRIHQSYVKSKEAALGEKSREPRPLVITIEEAHKFLEPAIAAQTIFGTIARELRKYNVTLFIVDQRPSGIDSEVMSQIGTRVTLLLDNEEDIRAVFMGVSGGAELRQVLARLESKEQALILGHAVPMPVVIKTRPYDLDFYKAVGYVDDDELQARLQQNTAEIRGRQRNRLE